MLSLFETPKLCFPASCSIGIVGGGSQSIVSEHRFFAPAGDANVSIVDVRAIAAVAAAALTESGHHGKTYDLNGPKC
jgi:uncharacterized protein YbjT (DUF2867 family)